MKRLLALLRKLPHRVDGSVFVEYLLLVTLVGIGVIAGSAHLAQCSHQRVERPGQRDCKYQHLTLDRCSFTTHDTPVAQFAPFHLALLRRAARCSSDRRSRIAFLRSTRRRGVEAVEVMVALPVLIVVTLAIFQFGILMLYLSGRSHGHD